MTRPLVADIVDSFFTRVLFQEDDQLASSTLTEELSADAIININGSDLSAEKFVSLITTQFRGAFTASISHIQDLNIVTTNDTSTTGVVGQYTKYKTKSKVSGQILKQSATTIVKVEERDGKNVVTALWEAQTLDEE
ncbi:uncharacterized protein IL334_005764 [Kwoniella shivajii]|uniref:SnoaL-like domain-containing protein n=1 Tax=Kwoniella shivajii TaxID=564305 RepID=A0ABZ1D420_9TREE|nr:hypothetical protein IL334_005764 [Kwoniella shivajii]